MASKKKGLPFVVRPRFQPIIEQIGSEDSGIIEIERRGYLTVAEKAMVQSGMENENVIKDIYTLGSAISRETGKPQADVVKDFSVQPLPDYLSRWEEEITKSFVAMIAYQERIGMVQATALIISRIDEKWHIDQTLELHPDLITALSDFYIDEENRCTDSLESDTNQIGGEIEGKS